MRRLWSYILLAFTTLLLVGVSFPVVANRLKSNVDYRSGTEMTFRISEKEASESLPNPKELDKKGLLSLADEFANRLDNSGVSSYYIKTVGKDTISVTLAQSSEENYSNIRTYLSCDGSFALASPVPGGNYATAENFLTSSKAYIDTYNSYPCIVLPIDVDSTEYKTTLETVKTAAADNQNEYAEEVTSGEGEEQKTTYHFYMYLFYNWDAQAYEEAGFIESSKNTDNSAVNRFCMKFEVNEGGSDLYFPDGKDNKLFSIISLDTNGDGTVTYADRELAYSRARFFINILNASAFDYEVTFMYQNLVFDGVVENLFSYGSNKTLALGRTLLVVTLSVVLVSALLIAFYKLCGVNISLSTIVTLFLSLLVLTLFKAEFHSVALAGFILVALVSLASGVVYITKFKGELYRGRSLKKANSEAAKKAFLPIVDMNVIAIIIGVFAYLFGGVLMRSFAVVAVIGGLISLVMNTLGLRILMWLVTNTTGLQSKYNYFGVNPEHVPNVLKEEKQTYFGNYVNRPDFKNTKTKKIIVAAVLVAISVFAVTFSAVRGGANMYGKNTETDVSMVYFETQTDNPSTFVSSLMKEETVTHVLEHTFVYTNDDTKAKALSTYVESIETPDNYVVIDSEKKSITHYQYVVTLKSAISSDMNAYYVKDDDTKITEDSDGNKDVNSIMTFAIIDYHAYDLNGSVSLKDVKLYNVATLDVSRITIGMSIATVILMVYYMLRYRSFSRGISLLVMSLLSYAIGVGAYVLLRTSLFNLGFVTVPLVLAFALIAMTFVMNIERENALDIRNREETDVHANLQKAVGMAISPINMMFMASAFIAIVMFGFLAQIYSAMYIGFAFLLVALFYLIPDLFAACSELFLHLFRGVHIHLPRRKKKAKAARINKSAEPEEAIFIGIND